MQSQTSSSNGKQIRGGAIKAPQLETQPISEVQGLRERRGQERNPMGGSGSRAAPHHKNRNEVWFLSLQPADCFISNYPNYLAW